ncbi:MAG TPA: hypothetical protein VIK91_18970, partial [Nannocystis sp.]
MLLRAGDLDAAERAARRALDLLTPYALDHAPATATLAAILLAQGRSAEALPLAVDAATRQQRSRTLGFKGIATRLVHAEALAATGDRPAALAVLTAAHDALKRNAAKIPDPRRRQHYLE